MATNQQRREAAKRKLDRQLARRAERAKRRKVVGAGVTVGAVVIVAGVVVFLVTRGETTNASAGGDSGGGSKPAAQATSGPCQYKPTPKQPAAKPVSLPPDPKPTPSEGKVRVALKTTAGTIDLTLNRATAPCTVQSIAHLVESGFYDNTPCHRLVSASTLSVLQCGDPTGKGTGGPGYTIPDELPTKLEPASKGKGKTVIYPRGTLAMAKSRMPNSGGSQFFMVNKDSTLPPKYSVFGSVAPEDMAILDKIAAAGIKGGKKSGKPAMNVTIEDAKIVERS